MAESIASDLAGKVLSYFVSATVERIAPYFGGSDQLERLEDTMRLIQARLSDAEKRQEDKDGAATKEWLRRLKRVLYKLEDLFEEVNMVDRQKQQIGGFRQTNPVRLLTFEFDRLKLNKKVYQDVKAITRELESIKSDMSLLNLRESNPIENQQHVNVLHRFNDSRETYSYINEKEVIGRENDRNVIVEMLLDSDSHQEGESVSVIPIVGIGGLGKTTLAQLCFNDRNVEQHFELKAWACISVVCSFKELVMKVLISFSGEHDCNKISNIEELQKRLREVIDAKRYLLVLDDVWDEDSGTWLNLKSLLCGGRQGSKIIVTTRSHIVADVTGTVEPYQLQCLNEEESWALFERLAFSRMKERTPKLTSIGREIVEKCVNVPLAIRTIATLLYSKHTEKEWEHFKDNELRMIDLNDIMSTLKLSYDHLPSHLKQCFAYCSLFPRDYELEKKHLICLWMAQGFIKPFENRSLEDVGDEYFLELLRRCFFQDVIRDEDGNIKGCKMHDLFHDLACRVGDECQLVYKSEENPRDNRIRHVSFREKPLSSSETQSWLLSTHQMRSVVAVCKNYYVPYEAKDMFEFCSTCRYLRALDMGNYNKGIIPNSIWKLKHLRYLRLDCRLLNEFGCVPNSIKGLQNLQILWFIGDGSVRLPKDFKRLTQLRHLLFDGLMEIHMPPQFGELTSLQTLSRYVVGENSGLDELGRMENLAGKLEIQFRKCRKNASSEVSKANLNAKKLTSLSLWWSYPAEANEEVDADQDYKALELPLNLKELRVYGWEGVEFPLWGGKCNRVPCLLPNLVSINIKSCQKCKYLPPLGQLPLLKYFSLEDLTELEYIENWVTDDNCAEYSASAAVYYPSLEELNLWNLPQLKGWSRSRGGENGQHRSLPCLLELSIQECPKLEWIPQVPRLPSFWGERLHGNLVNQLLSSAEEARRISIAEAAATVVSVGLVRKNFRFCESEQLHSLSINLSSLESLEIEDCYDLFRIIAPSPTSLRHLKLCNCCNLSDISGALQHLSLLEELEIVDCPELDWGDIKDEEANDLGKERPSSTVNVNTSSVSPWQFLKRLRKLTLSNITKVEPLFRGLDCLTTLEVLRFGEFWLITIPESIGHLTQLRELQIWACPELFSLPHYFVNLTNLQLLEIKGCDDLRSRCEIPNGEDWPLIQHIPGVKLYNSQDELEFDYSYS